MFRQQVAERPTEKPVPQAVKTTLARAKTLLDDGYSLEPTEHHGIYTVTTPERIMPKTGEPYCNVYTVDAQTGSCDCPQFQRYGVCKHGRAVQNAVAAARWLLTPQKAAPKGNGVPLVSPAKMGFQSQEEYERVRSLDFD